MKPVRFSRSETSPTTRKNSIDYERLFEDAKYGIILLDAKTLLVMDANEYIAHLSGTSRTRLIGKPFFETGIVKDPVVYKETFRELLRKKYVRREGLQLQTSDGRVLDVDLVGNLYHVGSHGIAQCNFHEATQTKTYEEKLKQLSLIVDNSHDGIALGNLGKNAKLLFVNPAWTEMFGYNAKEAVGKMKPLIIQASKRDPALHRKFVDAVRHEKMFQAEMEWLHKSGRLVPVEVTALPVRTNGDRPVWFNTVKDITEHKAADEALRKYNEALQTSETIQNILRSSPDAISITDLNGKIIECNDAALAMHGVSSRKQIINKPLDILIAPQDRHKSHILKREVLKKGKVTNVHAQLRRFDGTTFPAEFSAGVVKEASGKVIAFMITGKDITERKNIEAQLIMNKYAMDSAQTGIALVDLKGRLTYVNEMILRRHGLKSSERVIGKTPLFLVDDKKGLKKKMALVRSGKRWSGDINTTDKDGNKLVLQSMANLVKDPDGKPLGMMASLVDVTAQRRAEQELRKANADLKVSDEIKNNFLNMISHELKTPLTAVSAHLQILQSPQGKFSEQYQKSIAAIERNTGSLHLLIENLLETSRIDANKLELNISRVDLRELIERGVANLHVLADQKGIRIVIRISPIPPVRADSLRVQEILNNLLSNAIKFTEKGSVTITAKRQKASVMVCIKDTGIGIEKRQMPHLFEKFSQIDNTIRRRYGGTGLGLTITKDLVELQGGKVRVKSRYGKGSTFSFTLPIDKK